MTASENLPLHLPRLPVLGWDAFTGKKAVRLPCIMDHPNILPTKSGAAAIALALRAVGVVPGDRVLVPTYHCRGIIAPVVAAGAKPVFFPIDRTGAPILESTHIPNLSRSRALIAAHYFGFPQPMARIREFCDEHGIALIEDCAHAMFGRSDGRPVGSWGNYAIASLTKFFPVSDGGCLISTKRPLKQVRLRCPPFTSELKSLMNSIEIGAAHDRFAGINPAVRGFLAALGMLRATPKSGTVLPNAECAGSAGADRWLLDFAQAGPEYISPSKSSQLIARWAHRQRIVDRRRQNYAWLARLLAGLPGTKLPWPQLPEEAVPYVFPLWVEDPDATYQRIRASGIPIFRWDEVWPTTPVIDGDRGREWSTHVFQLGCHQDLDEEALRAMTCTLHRLFS